MPLSRFKVLGMILFLGMISGCIDPFTPKLSQDQKSLVVEGVITDQEGYHMVKVSRASSYNDPVPDMVSGCTVEILDENGSSTSLTEVLTGQYEVWLPSSFLMPGRGYQVSVITPEGESYLSILAPLPDPCPPVDSVYYQVEDIEQELPGEFVTGLQFYLDMDARGSGHEYYRWALEETWEYFSKYIPDYVFIKERVRNYPGDPMENHHCWKTLPVRELFTASTRHLEINRLKSFPLNFVSNETNRLESRYSLLVKQYAINKDSHNYWNQMRSQTTDAGGLYESQPAQLQGNIYNVNNPNELVLGYFDVVSISEKRIFVGPPYPFQFSDIGCELWKIESKGDFADIPMGWMYIVALSGEKKYPYGMADNFCFDCTARGGTTDRPDFWE